MTKSYPKDFVSRRTVFRLFLLLLLLLLLLLFPEAILGSTTEPLSSGAGAALVSSVPRKPGDYGENCSTRVDCWGEFLCDPIHKQCLCGNFIHPELVLFYHKPTGKCVAAAGKWCVLDDVKDNLGKIHCVPFATCTQSPSSVKQSKLFGICLCNQGAEETNNRLCNPTDDDGGALVDDHDHRDNLTTGGITEVGPSSEIKSNEQESDENSRKTVGKDVGNPKDDIEIHPDVKACLCLEKGGVAEEKCFNGRTGSTSQQQGHPVAGGTTGGSSDTPCGSQNDDIIVARGNGTAVAGGSSNNSAAADGNNRTAGGGGGNYSNVGVLLFLILLVLSCIGTFIYLWHRPERCYCGSQSVLPLAPFARWTRLRGDRVSESD